MCGICLQGWQSDNARFLYTRNIYKTTISFAYKGQ